MPDDPVKRRLRRAQRRVRLQLEAVGYHVSPAFEPFHLEAFREMELRKVRIALDRVTPDEVRRVKSATLPMACAKEIWILSRTRQFEIRQIP